MACSKGYIPRNSENVEEVPSLAPPMRRRTTLRRLGTVLLIGLAGCSGDDESGPYSTDSPTSSEEPPTSSSSQTSSGSPTDSEEPTTNSSSQTSPGSPTASPPPTETTPSSPTREPVAQTVEVAPDGSFSFSPEEFEIESGSTVRWTWDSGGHNVRPDTIPSDADWSGTEGGDSTTYGSDHTYEYEFTVKGTYEYYCSPHRDLGMTGSFTVT